MCEVPIFRAFVVSASPCSHAQPDALETPGQAEKETRQWPERRACEIRLRAERKAGQLLATGEKNKGTAQPTRSSDTTTLRDLGISKDQSSKWQQLAGVPERQFEAAGQKRSAL